MWLLYAVGSAVFAGLVAVLAKIGVRDIDSTAATAVRTMVVLAATWAMVGVAGSFGQLHTLTSTHWLFLGLSGAATGVSWLSYMKALQLGDVNKVAPVDKSSILITMLLAFLLFGEPLTLLKVFCMVLIGVGTYLMIEYKPSAKRAAGDYRWLFYAALSAVSAAAVAILAKIGMQGIDTTLGTAIRTVVVAVMAWLMVAVTGKWSEVPKVRGRSGVFLVLSGIATGASWLLYFTALQQGPASIVVPIDKLSILVTIILSYVVLRERISLRSLLGLCCIVAGTLLLLV